VDSVITQVVLKVLWKKDTVEVTTDHFGLQVLAKLQSQRALSLGFDFLLPRILGWVLSLEGLVLILVGKIDTFR